jgi:hypothetical protein
MLPALADKASDAERINRLAGTAARHIFCVSFISSNSRRESLPRQSYRSDPSLRVQPAKGNFFMHPKSSSRKKYSSGSSRKVKRAMHEMKRGKLKSGRSGKKVKSRKQAIAIGLSEARRSGGKVRSRKKKKS